ncbi:hypothetical protein CfE428DRAFT_2856 [Chthoniobacter flavus Ellin428]|uniref:Uncharacterized protein n=2 Tax=Chthoniobacter flavus TaxID=191863 RepID=B4D1R8_9BACT|nr:hypothetical protein CfE428DRAFT_2856 [Chthoniobacter flavus Ellin428]
MLFQEREKLLPFTGGARGHFFEEQTTRGVEDHGLIREPPVHVDRAADALEFILHARREADTGIGG